MELKMKITIDDFIDCIYDTDKEICSIIIRDALTVPPNKRNYAAWHLHLRKKDIEDAVSCKWLLFEGHDEVWIPTYDENGKRGEALIISADTDDGQLTHATFKQQGSHFSLSANARIVRMIHNFWKDIVSP
jgi:hypothetical protein